MYKRNHAMRFVIVAQKKSCRRWCFHTTQTPTLGIIIFGLISITVFAALFLSTPVFASPWDDYSDEEQEAEYWMERYDQCRERYEDNPEALELCEDQIYEDKKENENAKKWLLFFVVIAIGILAYFHR